MSLSIFELFPKSVRFIIKFLINSYLTFQRKTIIRGAEEECRRKRISDYIRKSKITNSLRTTHLNPENRYTSCINGKNASKLKFAYLRAPESTPSPSDYDENLKFCIQQ